MNSCLEQTALAWKLKCLLEQSHVFCSEGDLAGHCFCAQSAGNTEGPSSHSSFPLNTELDISSLNASSASYKDKQQVCFYLSPC